MFTPRLTQNAIPLQVPATDGSIGERSGLDLYFLSESGKDNFKATVLYRPFFYVLPDLSQVSQPDIVLALLTSTLMRRFEVHSVNVVHRIDLDQPNHLAPKNRHGRPLLQLVFDTTNQLTQVRDEMRAIIEKNAQRSKVVVSFQMDNSSLQDEVLKDPLSLLNDLREYDVPYVVRVCTNLSIRAGTWYTVQADEEYGVQLVDADKERKADPVFLAFDIECTKDPLKFPNAERDTIFMISYMVRTPRGSQGYLIVSRDIVGQDIADFEYTPDKQYPGPFTIFNEPDEKALLERFFSEYRKHAPQIVVTYNGDFFDWPFVETRANFHGFNMFQEIGVERIQDEFRGLSCVHLDAFHWVQRDSYLPQGAQGLKAVTRYKLGYDPVEVDPEDMVEFARRKPVHMATYSVSDAVATYYLYEKYVHLFIFSLCTIIPMGPEDVLRKGSGTLCETLLMTQASSKNILCPNKQSDALAKFHQGHLLESETYIGGKVECLETGVYRSDIEYEFDLKPSAFQQLIDNIDRDLVFAIEVEGGKKKEDFVNYDEVRIVSNILKFYWRSSLTLVFQQIRSQIVDELEKLRDRPKRKETPYIYHLDVGAMYPNIILSNRLQPGAIVDDATCAACDFNQSKNNCKRRMPWIWRGDYSPATKMEYDRTKDQLSREVFHDGVPFSQLPENEQSELVASRLKTYANKAYKRTKITEEKLREDVVCMRENDFYVDTVRQFRDRRYEYKALKKTWSKKSEKATDPATKKECEDRLLVYDSLQVAHKCILNSFYGYVMRKGARWRSMEMAGIVTKNGADIITQARRLVEQIGRPLELDTDGIWCILPGSFPDVYSFIAEDGSKLKLEYPCVMLNAACQDEFTNHQYQVLVDPERGIYETRSECSIFFEVDGPYRCMVLPASTEEGKLLKKRYAVFNFDGSLAELKGFELKRRGELELIKTFQSQVFERFLDGGSLKECYDSVADVANHWIDVIETRGESLDDDELVDLISENRNMSRQLEEYGGQKGTSQTTARRLAEFLGAELIRDKGLNCKFIISEQPYGAPVTERAVPTAIWKASPNVTQKFLRKWLKSPGLEGDALDIRNVLDWDYYLDRLGKTIQKIITIPAALQNIPNPVPRLEHPAWLGSKVSQMNDKRKQQSIKGMLIKRPERKELIDIEDIGTSGGTSKIPIVHRRVRNGLPSDREDDRPHEKRVQLSKENFNDWLKQKKATWRRGRKERRSQRFSTRDDDTEKRARTTTSMEGFVREAALSMARREWQIIEVREMTSYDSLSSGSGEFVVWAMVGTDSLQKTVVSVPRTVYISARSELTHSSSDITHFRRVERHLPHCRAAEFLYEVTMPEHVYKKKTWVDQLYPVDPNVEKSHAIESVYQSKNPSLLRLLSEFGNAVRLDNPSDAKNKKSYIIEDFKRIDKLSGGDYLSSQLSYRRLFLYVRINPSLKTGLVALFDLKGGSGSLGQESNKTNITRPSEAGQGAFDISASCTLWIVKPNSRRAVQRNVSLKECKTMYKQLIESIQESAGLDSDYSCIFPESNIEVSNLHFVDAEDLALAGANEMIASVTKSSTGPTFIFLNSSKEQKQLRRKMTSFNLLPVVSMPFPPGPAHNPAVASLPALNWETPLIQLSLEAYLFMVVISFPKRVSYARYGQIPLGNLGIDENITLFDTGMSRLLQKNAALSWASSVSGKPDLGENFIPSFNGGTFAQNESGTVLYSLDDAWEDEDELVSPIIRRPGVYRSVCVDIDVQDLAIAALSDMSVAIASIGPGVTQHDSSNGQKPESPTSVTTLQESFQKTKVAGPLGDEMSTSISLSIIRSMVSNWLRDAFHEGSLVADELLHHIYRLISDPNALLHDPALHRVVHALMKSTFLRVLGELQRLGCAIVYASFNRITVATNKIDLADAEEYVDFVINTAKNKSEEGSVLSKVSLRPKQFHTHFVFMNEFNFGTMQLERMAVEEAERETDMFFIENQEGESHAIVPSVVTGWSLTNYLGSQLAQEYFKAIIARFSRDVLKKQMELHVHGNSGSSSLLTGDCDQLSAFQKSLVEKHFSSYLTRAVDEIMKEGEDDEILPPLVSDDTTRSQYPALEFVKNLIAVLELDTETAKEVHALKRSLLAQVDVPEYARVAQWKDPCPTLILPDVFCCECQDSRDVNLCYVPPRDAAEDNWNHQWACEDCGTPYDVVAMESRLVHMLQNKVLRYQLQDLRYRKTRRVATWALRSDDCATDIPSDQTLSELKLMRNLAELHQLETLEEITTGLLDSFES